MAFLKNLFKDKKGSKKPSPVVRESEVQDVQTEVQEMPTIVAPSDPILRSFHISEKSARGMEMNQYTFIVHPRATKTQVRDAVHKSYNVDVVSVNLGRLPSKKRSIGRYRGAVASRRKAFVTLKDGQSIAAAQP